MAAIELIQTSGDMLEQEMFSDAEFASAFRLYPDVWARCVLPHRPNGAITLVSEEWIRFAERHYSAIVRCWNARDAHKEICNQCLILADHHDTAAYMKLHGSLFNFFCLCGAAIDNLEGTFASPPLKCVNAFAKVKNRKGGAYDLQWFYERRTQYVHKAIVPCFENEGLATFDLNMFHDSETRWDSTEPIRLESIADHVEKLWNLFTLEMTAAWSELLQLVKDAGTKSPKAMVLSNKQPSSLRPYAEGPFAAPSGEATRTTTAGSGTPLLRSPYRED